MRVDGAGGSTTSHSFVCCVDVKVGRDECARGKKRKGGEGVLVCGG